MKLPAIIANSLAWARGISADAFYLAFENGAKLVIGFFVSILVVNYLGPEKFGAFSYANVWISILTPLATLGLAGPLMKSLIHNQEHTPDTLKTILYVRLAAAALVTCLATGIFTSGILLDKNNQSEELNYVVGILALQYIAQVLDVFETYNQVIGQLRKTIRARLIGFLIVSGLRVVAVKMECDLTTFAWLAVLQLMIGFALTYSRLPRANPPGRAKFDVLEAKSLVKMGLFIVLGGTINMAQARCEIFILERFAGLEAVGLYSSALRFIELFDTIGTIAVTVYLPRLLAKTAKKQESDEAIVSTYRSALILYIAIIPLIVAMAIIAYFLLGSKFIGIHWLILAMAYRPLFTFLGLTRSMNMLAENRLRYSALCSSTGFVISTVSALIFIPIFGVYGAAISAFLGYFSSNLIIDAFLNKRYFAAFLKAASFK